MDNGAAISADEEAYLLRAVNQYLVQPIAHTNIVWRYAGVRPLFDDESDNPSAVTYDYTLVLQDAENTPYVSVYGGTITTYRRLAESVLDKLVPWMKTRRGSWSEEEALPGGKFKRADRAQELAYLKKKYAQLYAHFLTRLFGRHGRNAHVILKEAQTADELGRDFGGGLVQREVDYLIIREWAYQPDDILWRRIKCDLHMNETQRAEFAAWFKEHCSRKI